MIESYCSLKTDKQGWHGMEHAETLAIKSIWFSNLVIGSSTSLTTEKPSRLSQQDMGKAGKTVWGNCLSRGSTAAATGWQVKHWTPRIIPPLNSSAEKKPTKTKQRIRGHGSVSLQFPAFPPKNHLKFGSRSDGPMPQSEVPKPQEEKRKNGLLDHRPNSFWSGAGVPQIPRQRTEDIAALTHQIPKDQPLPVQPVPGAGWFIFDEEPGTKMSQSWGTIQRQPGRSRCCYTSAKGLTQNQAFSEEKIPSSEESWDRLEDTCQLMSQGFLVRASKGTHNYDLKLPGQFYHLT